MRAGSALPHLAVVLFAAAMPVFTMAEPVAVRDATVVTVGLRQPALSPAGDSLAFVCVGDLWVASAAGGTATRLTRTPTDERRPCWSPDGRWIACACRRDGEYDVAVLPASGGEPRFLTAGGGDDWPSGFAPDGSAVLFHSRREEDETRIFRVPIEGGTASPVTLDLSSDGVLSPEGTRLAFTSGEVPWWQSGYRGPAGRALLLMQLPGRRVRELAPAAGNHLWPQWTPDGGALLFVSPETVVPNLWRCDPAGGRPTRLTGHTDEAVRYPSVAAHAPRVAYEQAGRIRILELDGPPGDGTVVPIEVPLDAEPPAVARMPGGTTPLVGGTRPRSDAEVADLAADSLRYQASVERMACDYSSGVGVLEIRGDLFLLPTDAFDQARSPGRAVMARNLTPGPWRARDAAITPGGDAVLFAVDGTPGGYDLHRLPLRGVTGQRAVVRTVRDGPRDELSPSFSPDGKLVAYLRRENGEELVLADAEGGRERSLLSATRLSAFSFSPDGRWIAAVRDDEAGQFDLVVVPVFGTTPLRLTADAAMESEPRWSPDGGKLYFLSAEGGAATLRFFAWSADGNEARASGPFAAAAVPGSVRAGVPSTADSTLLLAVAGGPAPGFWRARADGTEAHLLAGWDRGVRDLSWLPGDSALVFLDDTGRVQVFDPRRAAVREVPFRATMARDPAGESRQIFDECWRLLAWGFYDPAMHLVDWGEVRRRYEPRLSACATTDDRRELILEMAGELNASHVNLEAVAVGRGLAAGLSAEALERARRWDAAEDVGRAARVREQTDGRIAYFHLRETGPEGTAALRERFWPGDGAPEAAILDLRNNRGGYDMESVVEMLARKPFARRRAREGAAVLFPADAWGRPLVVLVDETTASAAELVAEGLHSLGVGILVGRTTRGGVIAATEHRLLDGSRFQLPRVGWSTLDGANLENRGVAPDVEVPRRFEERAGEDRVLERALELLRERMPRH